MAVMVSDECTADLDVAIRPRERLLRHLNGKPHDY
jgi:hypothetical protein